MEKFDLRSSFGNISGVRECKRWIREVIDREDKDRVWVILWRPNIDSMGDEWPGKVGQGQSSCRLGLPPVRPSKRCIFIYIYQRPLVSTYLRIHDNNSTSIQSMRIVEIGDTDMECKSKQDIQQCNLRTRNYNNSGLNVRRKPLEPSFGPLFRSTKQKVGMFMVVQVLTIQRIRN